MHPLRTVEKLAIRAQLFGRHRRASELPVSLAIRQKGRHIPFFALAAITSFNGFQFSAASDIGLYRAARALSGPSRPARTYDDTEPGDRISINGRTWQINYAYFTEQNDAFYLPFYEHPETLLSAQLGCQAPHRGDARPTRILFAGSGLTPPYADEYHFASMNRNQVLETVMQHFTSRVRLNADFESKSLSSNAGSDIVFVINDDSANTLSKHALTPEQYHRMVQGSDFFLCPPGLRIPQSHNYVEAMRHGAIPIINYNEYLHPRLTHGENALLFSDEASLVQVVGKALSMTQRKIIEMRAAVREHYCRHLHPVGFWQRTLEEISEKRTLVVPVSIISPEASAPRI